MTEPAEAGSPPSFDPTVDLLSVDEIRSRFPALERRHAGYRVAYFDGPGGTQVPREVPLAMTAYLIHSNANRRWAYPSSAETDTTVEGARDAMADLLGCGAADVSFGANMTSLTFHLSRTLARTFTAGDEVVVTRLDHLANVAPWTALTAECGAVVRYVPFNTDDGKLDMDAMLSAITERTRLVAVGWASNALGTVVDLEPIVARAREVGALTFVDAVHAAPHLLPGARALGCDFMACSPYKFYGPHAGVLFARSELMDTLDPPRLSCSGQLAPERFELGTLPHESLEGTRAAVDFLASLAGEGDRRLRLANAYEELHARGSAQVQALWTGLSDIDGVTCHGTQPGQGPRTPTVAFTVRNHAAADVASHLSERFGVFVSHGHFYAANVAADLGVTTGMVRAGCACYTTEEEVARLVEGVAALV